ncbi:cupin domain-containing protein [Dyella sp. C9]|uniref:cupin domain-containing protein n=1 Tax=Dyella sp. C9 TaxID=2202154 RepID=UPI0013007067|nr:cupin domain-containing protein [Dyella sp. C9]
MKTLSSWRAIRALMALGWLGAMPGVLGATDDGRPVPAVITRTELEHSDVPGTDLETRLYLIVLPPGAAAPVHHHPVEGIGYIVEGAARSAFGQEPPVTLIAGQSFHDKAGIPHTVFENADDRKPLRFIVAYTVKKGSPVIEVP